MTYKRLPDNLPALLRGAGLKVVELDGWRTRGRPAYTGSFNPVGVLCHHTASRADGLAGTEILVRGRADLPGPLAHFGLSRDGTVYIVASGRANHAGRARSSGSVAAGDGNSLYIGIEAMNDGVGEPWPAAQMRAYETLAAVLSVHVTGNSVRTVRAHKETSVTGKIDPTFAMGPFRRRVAKEMARLRKPAKPARPRTTQGPNVDRARRSIRKAYKAAKKGGNKRRVRKLRRIFRSIKRGLGTWERR